MNESFNFKEFLVKVIEKGASDIHLHVDEKPYVRINGAMIKFLMKTQEKNLFLKVMLKINMEGLQQIKTQIRTLNILVLNLWAKMIWGHQSILSQDLMMMQ